MIRQLYSVIIVIGVVLTTNLYAIGLDTVGMLSKIYQLSSEATEIGKVAQGKLDDPRLTSFNNRMMKDHQTTTEALQDTASQLGVNLPKSEGTQSGVESLKNLSGKAFQSKYLEKGIGIHKQILQLLNSNKDSGSQSPLIKSILNNMIPRFSGLLDNAQSLQKEIGTN